MGCTPNSLLVDISERSNLDSSHEHIFGCERYLERRKENCCARGLVESEPRLAHLAGSNALDLQVWVSLTKVQRRYLHVFSTGRVEPPPSLTVVHKKVLHLSEELVNLLMHCFYRYFTTIICNKKL